MQNWHLYWISTNGIEDCFIVARSSRSAKRIECDECGWDHSEVTATRAVTIPRTIELAFSRRRHSFARATWPGYADDWLLKKLGAKTREREHLSEIYLDGMVYTNDPEGPRPPRPIGRRALQQLRKDPTLSKRADKTRWTQVEQMLFTMMGLCLARCQEIEHLIAHSFIFAVSEKEKRNCRTIADLRRGWKRKTLGALLRIIEEGYDIEPEVHAALNGFLEMRNRFVHSLTTDDRTDFSTAWGRDEMIAFLTLFEIFSAQVRNAFRSAFFASMQFGLIYLANTDDELPALTKKQLREASLFPHIFRLRQPSST